MTVLTGEILSANDKQPHDDHNKHPIAQLLDQFLNSMDDYRETIPLALNTVAKKQLAEAKDVLAKCDNFPTHEVDGEQCFAPKNVHEARDLQKIIYRLEKLDKSDPIAILEKCFFIGLFTEFDAYIGDLLKAIYTRKPSLYNDIKREITLCELIKFGNIETVKQDMLDKEVDTFRRNSYIDQFSELESKFKIQTLKSFPEWPIFVEMGQRRNLMTHNDGIISQQYLTICSKEGVSFANQPSIGQKLELGPSYLKQAIDVISKVGFMLAHTLWRKVLPDDLDEADISINNTIYQLLERERWQTAAEFGNFAMGDYLSKSTKDLSKRIRVINLAIALKQTTGKEASSKALDLIDWSASLREFRLACAVLKDEYDDAVKIMIQIGKQGELIGQYEYHSWPLFKGFRETTQFQQAYKQIYEEEYLLEASKEARKTSNRIQLQVVDERSEKPTKKQRKKRNTND